MNTSWSCSCTLSFDNVSKYNWQEASRNSLSKMFMQIVFLYFLGGRGGSASLQRGTPKAKCLQSRLKICHSTKILLELLFSKALSPESISTRKFPRNYFYLNFRDGNFFGALLLPSEVRSCQATCSHTNLDAPKHKREHDLNKKSFSETFGFKTSQQDNIPAEIFSIEVISTPR